MFKKKGSVRKQSLEDDFEIVLLESTYDNRRLSLIKSILDEHKIPYMVRDYGIGCYMKIISGSSIDKTDILVEKSFLENAKNILEQFPWNV